MSRYVFLVFKSKYSYFIASKKADYISSIIKRVETIYKDASLIEKVQQYVKSQYYSNSNIVHDTYREKFNLVDKLDKYWYRFWDRHGNHKWRSKLLHSILSFFLINVWIRYSQESYVSWRDFRKKLSDVLVAITD